MAKASAAPFPRSTPKLPELKLPKLDIDALFAAYMANLAAAHEAQKVAAGAAHAIAKAQHGYFERSLADAKAALRRAPKSPETVRADMKAGSERTVATTREVIDLTLAAQRRVAELVAERTRASAGELKALAA